MFMKKKTQKKGPPKTSDGAKKGGAPVPGNAWVNQALAGTYKFNTGGVDKIGKRPGFGKAGAASANQDAKMKGMVPTHGSDGAC